MAGVAAAATNALATVRSKSTTLTDTLVGEHEHSIVGYSLIKGIGDGEPIASERFTVGGHEWVLLLYPDGKRSSSTEAHMQGNGAGGDHANIQLPPAAPPQLPPLNAHQVPQVPAPGGVPQAADAADAAGAAAAAAAAAAAPQAGIQAGIQGIQAGIQGIQAGMQQNLRYAQNNQAAVAAMVAANQQQVMNPNMRRDTTNEYAALFVALIGEGPNPQGVVNTSEGKVVRAFHRFTLVDQTGQGRDLTKGRTREAGAVKISCARQDPNARNCHGYRKFVKRSILEDPARGYLVNDTIIIRYTIELVVSSGGALSRSVPVPQGARTDLLVVPPASLGADLGRLLAGGDSTDFEFVVEGQLFNAHKIVLQARSQYFHGLLTGPMREGQEGRSTVDDIKPPVFAALLHFLYTDTLPDEFEGPGLDVPMAQHLLVAADKYQLTRLRRICERRLCESVDVETVGTTLTLAEQNHAEELKKVCLDYVSRNLAAVMTTDGYKHMIHSCPQLQSEILSTIAQAAAPGAVALMPGGLTSMIGAASVVGGHRHNGLRQREPAAEDEGARRVRARRD